MSEQKRYIKTIDESGSINISEDVIAAIVADAATEVKGVFSLYYAANREATQKISRKEISRSVKLEINEDNIVVNISILLAKGHAANEVGVEVQNAIKTAALDAAGIKVSEVNVHICGVMLKSKPKTPADKQSSDK